MTIYAYIYTCIIIFIYHNFLISGSNCSLVLGLFLLIINDFKMTF